MLRVWKPANDDDAPVVACAWLAEYARARNHAAATVAGYRATLAAWREWGGPDWPHATRAELAAFVEWLWQRAREGGATNPGRVANKARAHLQAVLRWAAQVGKLAAAPELPPRRKQRSVAGRWHYSPAELAALYAAAGDLPDPRGWNGPGRRAWHWQAAIVAWWFYGLDTQTVFGFQRDAQPLRWLSVYWTAECPDRAACLPASPSGWLTWRRAKTGRRFVLPMPAQVRAHLLRLAPRPPAPVDLSAVVFRGGSSRPSAIWAELVKGAGLGDKLDMDGRRRPWVIQDMRKTCATDCERTRAGSAAAVLGHAPPGVTGRHYVDLDLIAAEVILTRAATAPACFHLEG